MADLGYSSQIYLSLFLFKFPKVMIIISSLYFKITKQLGVNRGTGNECSKCIGTVRRSQVSNLQKKKHLQPSLINPNRLVSKEKVRINETSGLLKCYLLRYNGIYLFSCYIKPFMQHIKDIYLQDSHFTEQHRINGMICVHA